MESYYAKKHSGWINQYAGMHYGALYLRNNFPDFVPPGNFDYVKNLTKLCFDAFEETCTNKRALDLGCCVGGITFQLAEKFDEVVGVDCSKGFIEICEELKKHGKHPIHACTEGELEMELMAKIPDSIDRTRCTFIHGDAHELPKSFGTFGCVVISNVLDRLTHPRTMLELLPTLVDDGGICVISSPHCSLEPFTPKENWIGGYVDNQGKEVYCSTTINEVMSKSMKLIETKDIAFVLQYRGRNFETAISEVQVWKK